MESVSNSLNLCTAHTKPHFKLAICCVVNMHTLHEQAQMIHTVAHLITKIPSSHENNLNKHTFSSFCNHVCKSKVGREIERLVGGRRQQWLFSKESWRTVFLLILFQQEVGVWVLISAVINFLFIFIPPFLSATSESKSSRHVFFLFWALPKLVMQCYLSQANLKKKTPFPLSAYWKQWMY